MTAIVRAVLSMSALNALSRATGYLRAMVMAAVLGTGAVANAYGVSNGIANLIYELFLRSEEHTSELQSRQYLVCRLLLEKKKKTNTLRRLNAIKTRITKSVPRSLLLHIFSLSNSNIYLSYHPDRLPLPHDLPSLLILSSI